MSGIVTFCEDSCFFFQALETTLTLHIAGWLLNPFRAPEPLPILNPSNFVPTNGFPVVKGLTKNVLYYIILTTSAVSSTNLGSKVILLHPFNIGIPIPGSLLSFTPLLSNG